MAAAAALTGGMIIAPGLSTFGAGNHGSIFAQDQGLTTQWDLDNAVAAQQAAMMEDSGGVGVDTGVDTGSSTILVPMSISLVLCMMCFSFMIVSVMMISSGD